MTKHPFAPDPFAVGLLFLGGMLMVFPSLRVAGVVAATLAAIYWLLMGALSLMRR